MWPHPELSLPTQSSIARSVSLGRDPCAGNPNHLIRSTAVGIPKALPFSPELSPDRVCFLLPLERLFGPEPCFSLLPGGCCSLPLKSTKDADRLWALLRQRRLRGFAFGAGDGSALRGSQVPAPTCEISVEGCEEGVEYEVRRPNRGARVSGISQARSPSNWCPFTASFLVGRVPLLK